MTTGVITTSFPGHSGDFTGCFVEDDVHVRVAAGETVDVIAPGGPAANDRQNGQDGQDRQDCQDGQDRQDRQNGQHGQHRPDLAPAVRVLRIRMPMPMHAGMSPLFLGAGAPEALERGGANVWAQAVFCWAGLCEETRRRAQSWDRIVAHWLVPCALAARAVAPHLPLTAYAHGGDVALLERIWGGASIGRQLALETNDLIFASGDLRERFARLIGICVGRVARRAPPRAGAAAASSLAVAIAPRARQPERTALGLGGRVVLSVGRLVPIKGFDVLLRAVAISNAANRTQDNPPPTVVILGDGSERARLEDMARRLNIDLRLPGMVPRSEVARWMSSADLYVQPSRRLASGRTEGLPTATLEALALGLPVIASATGGLTELAEDHPIRLVPADNPQALGACLVDWARQTPPELAQSA